MRSEFVQRQLFVDISAWLASQPDLALETILVIIEGFTFVSISQEHQSAVQSLFGMLVNTLDTLFGEDVSAGAGIPPHECFVDHDQLHLLAHALLPAHLRARPSLPCHSRQSNGRPFHTHSLTETWV
jgi:hypothetical protein